MTGKESKPAQDATDAPGIRDECLPQRQSKASTEELHAIAERAAARVTRPYVDHAELLYDDRGLPK